MPDAHLAGRRRRLGRARLPILQCRSSGHRFFAD
jgi:hypothetical protein